MSVSLHVPDAHLKKNQTNISYIQYFKDSIDMSVCSSQYEKVTNILDLITLQLSFFVLKLCYIRQYTSFFFIKIGISNNITGYVQ